MYALKHINLNNIPETKVN